MFGSNLFPAFYGPRSRFLISAFRNASQKRSSQRASGHTSGSGGKTSYSRWSTGRVRRGCSCMFCWFETVSTKPISRSAIIWLRGGGRQAAEPLPCIALSFLPAGRRRQQLPCQNCNAFWIGPLQRCSPLVCSFPTSMYDMSHVRMLQPVETREADPADVAMLRPSRSENLQSTISLSKKNQLRQRRQPWRSNIACVGQRPFDELSSEGLSLL